MNVKPHPSIEASVDNAIERLGALFRRNGYVRRQNIDRLEAEGYMLYKKGDEVRMVAHSLAELAEIRRLLRVAGLKIGRPFSKSGQYRQPIYGRGQVACFLELIGADLDE